MGLSREAILAARRNRKPVRLEVPEWGGDVWVKVLSAEDQANLAEEGQEGSLSVPMKVLVACLCDEEGTRLFSDEDAAELAKEDAPVIMRVFSFAAKTNGLTTTELDEAMASFGTGPEVG
jgi:hypothetical protein